MELDWTVRVCAICEAAWAARVLVLDKKISVVYSLLPLHIFPGAGESGKSTVFKQMRILYGKGYINEDRKQVRLCMVSAP